MTKWVLVVLTFYTVLIFLPPIIYGYTYPNSGEDSYWHIQRIVDISNGIKPSTTYYWGDYIVGYPLILLSKTGIPIATSFMWFNFLMLWAVGISCYILVSYLFTKTIGLVVFPLMFASPSIMNLYDAGALYNLMTVGILIPLGLVALLHILRNDYEYLPILVVLLVLGVSLHSYGVVTVQKEIANGNVIPEVKPVIQDLWWITGRPIIILMLGLSAYMVAKWKDIQWTKELKISLLLLSASVILSGILSLVDITGFSARFAINFGILFSITTMCLMGICFKLIKSTIVECALSLTTIIISAPIILTYYGVR